MKKYWVWGLVALALFFKGCTVQKVQTDEPKFIQTTADFKVHIVDKLPYENKELNKSGTVKPQEYAQTVCKFKKGTTDEAKQFEKCEIYILKSHYPKCLTHEIRHIFEGHWHKVGEVNSKDCN